MAVSELLAVVGWQHLLGASFIVIVACFLSDFATLPRCPEQIPAFGFGRGIWAHMRNSVAFFSSHKAWVEEGYARYNKNGLPFTVPAAISRHSDVVLPRALIPWLMEQPEDVVSARAAHSDILYGDYNFIRAGMARQGFGARVVHKALARSLPGLVPAIDAEVRHALGLALAHVGDGDDWTALNLWDFWLAVVPRVTNRVLAGAGVCRDERFVEAMVGFTDAVVRNCILLNMCPRALHPLVGRLLAIPNRIYWRRAHKVIGPVMQRRLDDMMRQARGDPAYKEYAPPEDFITWLIRLAVKEERASALDPVAISLELLPLEFASIHTTMLTGHAWMLDLLSMPPGAHMLDVLAAEIRAHMPEPGAEWSKPALQSLVRVDSSIRESQRLSNFADTLVERAVVAPEGLRHPDFDWTLSRGLFVTVNLDGTHHDEQLYPNARAYDPLRFSRIREAEGRQPPDDDDETAARLGEAEEDLKAARALGMVTTSDQHLAFGHGRHACPGRFFVAHELKLIMAHLLLHYDMQSLSSRPEPRWLGATIIPPLGASINIRRKKVPQSMASV
ncbi:hypothetical protein HIM_03831 [Hirsutella minnesotensis 3608]|uniref:Cytochrome P450 n=1 Tax=Hirsutella minnesotensis 3608 TaxID=1043627 RepID=A0A0F8A6E8_9HYPO|nr:hypothetical protein HIM_03831 [Hirsutella minnesotensis 3608]